MRERSWTRREKEQKGEEGSAGQPRPARQQPAVAMAVGGSTKRRKGEGERVRKIEREERKKRERGSRERRGEIKRGERGRD